MNNFIEMFTHIYGGVGGGGNGCDYEQITHDLITHVSSCPSLF